MSLPGRRLPNPRLPALALAAWATLLPAHAQDDARRYIRADPDKIVSAEACGECHAAELEVWKRTPHSTGFKTLHRKESAEAVRDRLGLRLIKRDSRCLGCHYTPTEQSGQLRAVSGVSCESCHGAGRDWLNVHNDYGGKDVTYASESPEHRTERVAASRQAGMRRPSDLYPVVKSCFGCHSVPDETLVNVGGHSIGSADFEFVAWSQGQIRHNFLATFRGGSNENAERGAERKRLMYVVGRAVALEAGLRGVAAASEEGVYLKAMQRRVRVALSDVRAIARRGDLPEVDTMVAAVKGVKVALGQTDALLAAADAVGSATQRFLERHDGTALAALDPLVLGTPDDLGDEDVEIADTPDTPAAEASTGTAADVPTAQGAADPGTSPSASTTAGARPRRTSGAVPVIGEFKRKIHPPSRFKTLGPGVCSSCHSHSTQSQWWFDDAHYRAADRFFDPSAAALKIARFYGLKPSQMLRGDHVCMDCHGSVVSGRESAEVQDGVGCESCHGGAAEYKEPHQEGDKGLGAARPGYKKALGLGMTKLRDPETRARTCTSCHYITEPRLISAGHSSGRDFDYLAGMSKIDHWEDDSASADAWRSAFAKVLAARGPVPEVQRARLGVAEPTPAVATAEPERGSTPTEFAERLAPRPRPPSRLSASAATPPAGDSGPEVVPFEPPSRTIELPPFPEIDTDASVEDVLLLLKKRLELLYRKVYQEPGQP